MIAEAFTLFGVMVAIIVFALMIAALVCLIFSLFHLEEYKLKGFDKFYDKYVLQMLIWFMLCLIAMASVYVGLKAEFV